MANFIVETSARHVHVTKETLEALFGEGFSLEARTMLSQPGQFASFQRVIVKGPKGSLKCSILGPVRKENQVELSITDARSIGISAPIRESGDTALTPGCILINPDNGCEVKLENGVIVAKRHIHMTEDDAKNFNVKNGDIVSVKILNETGRNVIFSDTVIRVSNNYSLAMHIDTDEANCCALGTIKGTIYGEIVK